MTSDAAIANVSADAAVSNNNFADTDAYVLIFIYFLWSCIPPFIFAMGTNKSLFFEKEINCLSAIKHTNFENAPIPQKVLLQKLL